MIELGHIEPGTTEQRILDAAGQEFIEKGLSGSRMESIARRAKVNKALIHYYFRSKQRLYQAVLENILGRVWAEMEKNMAGLNENADVVAIVRTLVATFINTLKDSPSFPRIFLRELADGGDSIHAVIDGISTRFGGTMGRVFSTFKQGVQEGTLLPVDPIHIMMNIMGMCAATFIFKPVAEKLSEKFQQTPVQFDDKFYSARIMVITETALHGLLVARRES
jgi:TetR/AcrR family transcriptional regulator